MHHRTNIDLFLVVPPGLDPFIFPWGVNSLSDYVVHFRAANPRIWALSEEPWLEHIATTHAEALADAIGALTRRARGVFMGHTASPHLFIGVIGALGARFLDVAQARGLLRTRLFPMHQSRLGAALDEISRVYRQHLAQGVQSCLALSSSEAGTQVKRVWGISVYDYTLFNSLLLSQVIRDLDPTSTIVLGGDYFDYGSASTVLRDCQLPSAIVVGYGEEVLCRVLEACANDEELDRLEHTGLLTRRSLTDPAVVARMHAADQALGRGKSPKETREAAVAVPPSYRAPQGNSPVDYVQVQDDGTVRILTQRGCSWGKCTFCSQIDRRLFFVLGLDTILSHLQSALSQSPKEGSRHLSLDADENDLNAVLPLLDAVQRMPGQFTVEFWLMVRKFGAELPRFLLRSRNIKATVILNVESLNECTLKRMKKGVVPLQIIEAVKAIQDVGHDVRSNYFLNFPGEDLADVRQESHLLEQVIHLLHSERMQLSAFTYMSNTRDEIHYSQSTFGPLASRPHEDVWLKEGFGVDLPFSIWTLENRRPLKRIAAKALVPFTYHKLMFARRAAVLDRTVRQAFGDTAKQSWSRRASSLADDLPLAAWSTAHSIARWLARDSAYARRGNVFDPAKSGGQPSRFFVEGSELVRDCHVPGATQSFRRRLCHDELTLLTFLYWRRKRSELVQRFAAWDEGRLDELLNRHLDLRSVVTDGRSWLSVVHHPEYWQSDEAAHEGPRALTDLEPRLEELKQLRPKRRKPQPQRDEISNR